MAIAGLRTRWDRLTGETWGRDFEEWVERNVIVSTVRRWQMESFTYQRQRYKGGVGTLEYEVLDASNSANVAHLNRLLHLAFYTGIGYKTTMGLGQVRIV
jgi:CRISPR-associated endoribonuclease Cas6